MTIPKNKRRTIHIDGEECEYAITKNAKLNETNIFIKGQGREEKLQLPSYNGSITPQDVKEIFQDKEQWLSSLPKATTLYSNGMDWYLRLTDTVTKKFPHGLSLGRTFEEKEEALRFQKDVEEYLEAAAERCGSSILPVRTKWE